MVIVKVKLLNKNAALILHYNYIHNFFSACNKRSAERATGIDTWRTAGRTAGEAAKSAWRAAGRASAAERTAGAAAGSLDGSGCGIARLAYLLLLTTFIGSKSLSMHFLCPALSLSSHN